MSTINHTFKSIPDSIRKKLSFDDVNHVGRLKNSLNNVTDRKLLYTDAFKLFSHLQNLTSSSADGKLTDTEIVDFALNKSKLDGSEFKRIFGFEKPQNPSTEQQNSIKTKVLQFYKDIVVIKNNRTVAKQYLQYTLFGKVDKFDGQGGRFNDPMDFFYGSESSFESELFRDLLVASGVHRHNYFDSIIGKGLNFAWTNTASNIIFNMIYGISVNTAKENPNFQKDLTDAILEGVRRDDHKKTSFEKLDDFLDTFKKDGYEAYESVSNQREQQIVHYAEKFAPYFKKTNSKSIPNPKPIGSNRDQLAGLQASQIAIHEARNTKFTYDFFVKKIGISFDDITIDPNVDVKMKAALGSLNSIQNLDSLKNQLTGIYELALSVEGLKEILEAVQAQQDQNPMEQAKSICGKLKLDERLSPFIANVILFYSTVQNRHLLINTVAQLTDLNEGEAKLEAMRSFLESSQGDHQCAINTISKELNIKDKQKKEITEKFKKNINEWIFEVQGFQISAENLSKSLSYSSVFDLKKSKLISRLFSKKLTEMEKEAEEIKTKLVAEMKSILGSVSVFIELLDLKSLQDSSEILKKTLLKFDKYIAEISQYLNPEMTRKLQEICRSFPRYLELKRNLEFIKQVQEKSTETVDFKKIFKLLASSLLENQKPVYGMIVPNLYKDQFGEYFELLPMIVKAHQDKKLPVPQDVLNALNRYCINLMLELPDAFLNRLMLNLLAQDKKAVNCNNVNSIIRFIDQCKNLDKLLEAATNVHDQISTGKKQNLEKLCTLSTEFEFAEKTISDAYKTPEARFILSQTDLTEIAEIETCFAQLKAELDDLKIWKTFDDTEDQGQVSVTLKNRVLRIYLNSLVDNSDSFETECARILKENVDERVVEIGKKFTDLQSKKNKLEKHCEIQIEKAQLQKVIFDYKKRLDSITQGLGNCNLEITQSHAQLKKLGIFDFETNEGRWEGISKLDEVRAVASRIPANLTGLDVEYLRSYFDDLKAHSLDAFEARLTSQQSEALLLKMKIEGELENRRAALVQIVSGLELPDKITFDEVKQAFVGISEIINSANENHQSIASILASDHVFESKDKERIKEYYYNTTLFDLLKKCGLSKNRCFVRINQCQIEGLNQTDPRYSILLQKIRQYNKWIAAVESYMIVQNKIKIASAQFGAIQETELLKDEIGAIKIKVDQFKELNAGLEQFFNTTQEALNSDAQLVENTTKVLLRKALESMFERTSFPNFLALLQKSVPEIEHVEENSFENVGDLFGALFTIGTPSVSEESDTVLMGEALPNVKGTGHEYTFPVKQKLPERLDTKDKSTQTLFRIFQRKENGLTPTSDEEAYIKQQFQNFHKEKNLAQKLMSTRDCSLLDKVAVAEFLNYFVVKLPVILSLMSQDDSQKRKINSVWHDIAFRSGLFNANYSLEKKIEMYLSSFSSKFATEFQTLPSFEKTPVDNYLDLMIGFNICKGLESCQKLVSIVFEVQKTFLTKLAEELNLSQGLQKKPFDFLLKYLASDEGMEKSYIDSLRTSDGSIFVKFPENYFSEGFQKYLVRGEKFKLLAYLMRAESEPISVRPSFVVIQERAECDSGTQEVETFLVNGIDKFIRRFSANRVLDHLDLFSLFTDSFYGQKGQYFSLLELRHLIPFEKLNDIIDGEELAHEIQKAVVSIFAFAAMKWKINLSEILVKIRSKASAMIDGSYTFHLKTWYSLINSCAAVTQMLQKIHGNYRDTFLVLGDNLESTFVASSVDQAPAIMDKVSSGQIQVGSLILEKLSKLFILDVAPVDVLKEIIDVIAGFRGVGNWSVEMSLEPKPLVKANLSGGIIGRPFVLPTSKRTCVRKTDLLQDRGSIAWQISKGACSFLREQIAGKIDSVNHVKSGVLDLLLDRQLLLSNDPKTIGSLKKHYQLDPTFKSEEAVLLDQFCLAFSIRDDLEILSLAEFLAEDILDSEKSGQILEAYQGYIKINGVFLTQYEKSILDEIYNVETNITFDEQEKHFYPSGMVAREVKSDGNCLLTSFLLELRRLEDGGAKINGFNISK